jgi:hypothetical protein
VLAAVLLALALVAGAGFAPARAQTDGLQMNAAAAFNGYFKYGEWLPVQVTLENQGADLEGEIRVNVNSSQGALVFSSPVSLPSGSRKLVQVYVLPNNFSRELDVRLVSGSKLISSQKVTVRPQPNVAFFAGLLAPERGALALLSGVKFPGQERPKILVDAAPTDLPDRLEGLRAFDLLVVNDVDTTRLTPEQSNALEGWVRRGGVLVIGGGPGAQRTLAGLPQALAPVRGLSTREISRADLQPLAAFAGADAILADGPFTAALGEPVESAILAGGRNLPLALKRPVGDGAVYYLALDLTGAPFNGWPATAIFWQALVGPAGSYPDSLPFDVSPRQWRANALTYPLSNIPSLDLPSIRNVSILLGVYILIVGPLNYLVLRRQRRLQWAWATIPAITLIFTAGAFGIGYGLRGSDLILNKIAVVETRPGGAEASRNDATVTSYMGLFSPRMQSYEIAVQGVNLISPMAGYDSGPWGGGPSTGGEMVLQQGEPSLVKGLTVNQWAMQSFMAEGIWEDFGSFRGELRLENEALVGTIRNDSAYTITDVVVTMQSRFQRLGDIAPGEAKEVNLALASLQSDRFGPPLSYRLFQEQTMNGPMPRALEQKSSIISGVFENGQWTKFSPTLSSGPQNNPLTGALVFGWLDQAPPVVQVPQSDLTQRTTALVYTALSYNLPDSGALSLPPGLIAGSVIKMPASGGTCGSTTSIHMTDGEAEFQYQIPENLASLRVDTLKLSLWRDSGGQGILPGLALYDWEQETWVSIQDPIEGNNIIKNAAPYIGESGLVRVQMAAKGDTFGCVYLDLGLETAPVGQQGG